MIIKYYYIIWCEETSTVDISGITFSMCDENQVVIIPKTKQYNSWLNKCQKSDVYDSKLLHK